MGDRDRYRFRSEWLLPATPDRVFNALADLGDYVLWWPEIKQVARVDEDSATITCRATLPFELVFTTTRSREDRDDRVLEATLRGDLEGTTRWTIRSAADDTTVAVFDEDVVARKRLLRAFSPVARPVFGWNHEVMMRHGHAGLIHHLTH
jgi:ribosome-associated toxin RatA of RatAB toxin-antitoxin module